MTYMCVIDTYAFRELLSKSSLNSIRDDLHSLVSVSKVLHRANERADELLGDTASPQQILDNMSRKKELDDRLAMIYLAYLGMFKDFMTYSQISTLQHEFNNKNTADKLQVLKEVFDELKEQ